MGGEGLAELGVARDGGMPDPVDRLDAVHHAHRVQPPPPAGSEDTRVDLQVEVAVRVSGTGGVVPHHGGLELLDRHLHLPAPGPDARGGVLGEPPDDLGRSTVLGCVVGGGDLRVQRRRQRPGLRTVHHDLDEPQPPLVRAEPALRGTGRDVVAGDPPLVGVPVQRPPVLNCGDAASPRRRGSGGDVPGRDPGAFGEVVVVDPGAVGLHVRARRGSGAAVELDPTVHASSPPVSRRHLAWKRRSARPEGRTDLRTFVACVPLELTMCEAQSVNGFVGTSRLVGRRQHGPF